MHVRKRKGNGYSKGNAWQITHRGKKGLNEKKLYSYMQACDTQPLTQAHVFPESRPFLLNTYDPNLLFRTFTQPSSSITSYYIRRRNRTITYTSNRHGFQVRFVWSIWFSLTCNLIMPNSDVHGYPTYHALNSNILSEFVRYLEPC